MLKKSTLFILFVFATGIFYAQDYNALVYKGNRNFENKKYDDASAKYLDAIKKNPQDFTAHYNLGNSLYKQKMYKEAHAEYKKAAELSKNTNDKMASLYNQGNAMMQQNNHEEAAKYYKEALKLSPADSSLRKNYEIAMLKDKEKKQKNGGGGNDQNNKNQQGNQGQQDNNQGDKKDQQGGNDQKNKGQGDGQDQNKNEGKNKLPKDVEKEILRQMGDKEKNTSKRILNQKANSSPISNEKDW